MSSKKRNKRWYQLSLFSFGLLTATAASLSCYSLNSSSTPTNVTYADNTQTEARPYAYVATTVNPSVQAQGGLMAYYPAQLLVDRSLESVLDDVIITNTYNTVESIYASDIVIDYKATSPGNLTGTIDMWFKIINFKAASLDPVTKVVSPVKEKEFHITIWGMKTATVSDIPEEGEFVPVPKEFESMTNVHAKDVLASTILPKLIGGSQIKGLFKIEVPEARLIYPNSIEVTAVFYYYFNAGGTLVSSPTGTKKHFTLTGFKLLENSKLLLNTVSASALGKYANEVTLEDLFPLIQSNFENLSKPLEIKDIANFTISSDLVSNSAIVTFDLINDLWIQDAVIASKFTTITFINFKIYDGTCINNVIQIGLPGYTTKMLQDTVAGSGDWKDNTSLKQILLKNTLNLVKSQETTTEDIEIISVEGRKPLPAGKGLYGELLVNFSINNSKALDVSLRPLKTLQLTTTIVGFEGSEETSIAQTLLAKYNVQSSAGNETIFLNNKISTLVDEIDLKNIIISNIVKPKGQVGQKDIVIQSSVPHIEKGTIDVTFQLVNGRYQDASGNAEPSHDFSIEIYGFQIFGLPTNISITEGMVLNATTSFPSIIPFDGEFLANNVSYLETLMKTFVSGAMPSNFSLSCTDVAYVATPTRKITFNVVVKNSLDANGKVVPETTIPNVQISELLENQGTKTIISPVISIDNNYQTIEDYRPSATTADSYERLKNVIIRNVIRPSSNLGPADISFVGEPKFSARDNCIEVTFKILGKYFDGTASVTSQNIKIKIVGFKTINEIKKEAYQITKVENSFKSREYATSVALKVNEVTGASQLEILEKQQEILSQYVAFNISNLNPEYTQIKVIPNDNDTSGGVASGSLTIQLLSSHIYPSTGGYDPLLNTLGQIKIDGFAKIDKGEKTDVVWPVNEIPEFASSIGIFNVSKYVVINNLPVIAIPRYEFAYHDTVYDQESNSYLPYGLLDVKIILNAYFDKDGTFINDPTKPLIKTKQLKTKANLNTAVNDKMVNQNNGYIEGSNLKQYLPTDVSDAIVKNTIAKSLIMLPKGFNPQKDINIIKREADDKNGSLTVSFQLTKYYEKGNIVQGGASTLSFNDVVFTNFASDGSTNENIPFYKQLWFVIIASVTIVCLIILIIVLIAYATNSKKKDYRRDDYYRY